MSDEMDSTNWWDWDDKAGEFSFRKTEDYIFAPYRTGGGKRIGDMTSDELIQVIATGYHEREQLAKAFLSVLESEHIATLGLASEIDTARLIVKRLESK